MLCNLITWSIALFYLFWVPFVFYLKRQWFGEKFNFLYKIEQASDPIYDPYTRSDRKNWNEKEFLLCGIFLAPIRLFTVIATITIATYANKLLVLIYGVKDLSDEHPDNFKRLSKRITKIATSILVYAFGYHNIKREYIKVDKSKYKNLKIIDPNDPEHLVTLVISNHVTFLEILFNMSNTYQTSFISKSGVKKFPLVGFYAACIQSIFVERESKENRSSAIDKIGKRIKDLQEGKNYTNLVLFPEGTTSSGHFLTSFKKGAFIHKVPLKVTGVKYFGNMNVCLNMMSELEAAIAMIFQWNKSMTYYEIERLVAPAKEMEWEEYANEVKKMMCQEFGMRSSEATYRAKKEFEMKYCSFDEKSYH